MANPALIPVVLLLAQSAAPAPQLSEILKRIEERYNNTKTLKTDFQQTMAVAQGRTVSESGVLYLRKPGQMRWEYAQPKGKLFLTDGKQIHYVTPAARRVEVSAMKESEDLRAPLAFLLGKLDFSRDFQRFEYSAVGTQWKIKAIPKSQKSMFEFVEFVAGADGFLSVVTVAGKDGSTMTYSFANEQRNLPLASKLFQFEAPEGFEVVKLRGEL
ncbi:outer membrane lipoprotein chaperone LolA [Bryobacter aggregatus]|uniref:outer membrane lipoprotein chaperone LolA n=1 Tax=Bryobacter aggregatus TaxID=360054 RepID=UPI0004E129B3|nr:outer membrane lipoprotein chaperone LolA [Bryobacter aggregatus]